MHKVIFGLILLFSLARIPAFGFVEDVPFNFNEPFSSNVTDFLDLTDTPSSYTGEGGNCVKVNIGETGLEFDSCAVAASGVSSLQSANGFVLLNDTDGSILLTFNGTLLNSTIDAREIDTNDTSYVTNLSTTDCSTGALVIGVQTNGTVLCATDTATNSSYLLVSNWNSTNTSYLQIVNWNATNSSYYLASNPSGYINWTNAINGTLATWTNVMNGTVFLTANWNATNSSYLTVANWNATNTSYYLATNPFGYYNSTTLPASGGYSGIFVNWTSTTTTGNISNGTLSGYKYANILCNAEYAGSHMCTMDEIIQTINEGVANTNFTATFRVSEGAPGYLANANDCSGWTSVTGADLGSIFVGSTSHANTYGSGSLVSCSASRAIGCCI